MLAIHRSNHPDDAERRRLEALYRSGILDTEPEQAFNDIVDLAATLCDVPSALISFADTMPKLADGSLNAVLSSGDGGAGRKLWEYLPYFSEITYSLPLSVAAVNKTVYDGLSADQREAIDAAGHKTETGLWLALSTRLQENYARMRQNGVTIESTPSPDIIAALQSAAVTAQRAWCGKAGPGCAQILDAYKAGKP